MMCYRVDFYLMTSCGEARLVAQQMPPLAIQNSPGGRQGE